MHDIPKNIREQVILLNRHTSKTQREIAQELGISQKSVSRILRRYMATNSLETSRATNCGRNEKLSARSKKMIVRMSTKNPQLSVSQIKFECGAIVENVSRRTVNRVLTRAGLRSYRAVKRPVITPSHRVKRFNWCRMYVNHPVDFWSKVSFLVILIFRGKARPRLTKVKYCSETFILNSGCLQR